MKELSKERIYRYLSYVLTLIIIIIFGYILNKIPNILDEEHIRQTYINKMSDFVAERSEFLQYAVLTVMFPILYLLFSKIVTMLGNKLESKINLNYEKVLRIILVVFSIIAILIVCMVLYNNIDYIKGLIKQGNLEFMIFIIILGLIALYLYKNTKGHIIIYTLIIISILGIAYLYVTPKYEISRDVLMHVDAYYAPILKIISGLTPGIDFNSIYGYYGYFFAPILSIFNTHRILIFSIMMAGLMAGVLFGIAFVLNKFIKNKFVLLITVFAIFFTCILYRFMTSSGIYMQYSPHRMIFPVMILVYLTFYLSKINSSKKMLYKIIGFIISSFAMFWNLETGIVTLGVWTLTLIYESLYFNPIFCKKTLKNISSTLILALSSVLLYFTILNVVTVIRTGVLINPKDIIWSQTLFAKDGFYMLKMRLWDPWLLLVIMYSLCLAKSLGKVKFTQKEIAHVELGKEEFNLNIILFALSILGMGVFSYYQGRSHSQVFLITLYPGIMLLGLILDYLMGRVKDIDKSLKCVRIVFVNIIAIALLSTSALAINMYFFDKDVQNWKDKNYLKENSNLEPFLKEAKKLKKNIPDLEFVVLHESLVYAGLKMQDRKNFPTYIDTFKYDDMDKIWDYIKEQKKSLMINTGRYNIIATRHQEEFEDFINEYYKVYDLNGNMLLVRNGMIKDEKILEKYKQVILLDEGNI